MGKLEKRELRVGYSQLDELVDTLGEKGLMSVICERMMEGFRPSEVAKKLGLPWLVMWEWIGNDAGRQRAYDQAHEAMSQEWHRETIEIADGADKEDVAVAKLRIDTRFKVVSNYDRKRFGQSVNVDVKHSGVVDIKNLLKERAEKLIGSGSTCGDVIGELEDKNIQVLEYSDIVVDRKEVVVAEVVTTEVVIAEEV